MEGSTPPAYQDLETLVKITLNINCSPSTTLLNFGKLGILYLYIFHTVWKFQRIYTLTTCNWYYILCEADGWNICVLCIYWVSAVLFTWQFLFMYQSEKWIKIVLIKKEIPASLPEESCVWLWADFALLTGVYIDSCQFLPFFPCSFSLYLLFHRS